jgi:hypothetical protein
MQDLNNDFTTVMSGRIRMWTLSFLWQKWWATGTGMYYPLFYFLALAFLITCTLHRVTQ